MIHKRSHFLNLTLAAMKWFGLAGVLGKSAKNLIFVFMHPILEKHLPKIEQACRAAKVRRLFVFGSVLTDQFGENSDVDFIAEFAPMTPEDYADHYFQLCEDLEAILQRPVDVITPAAIRNPIFQIELETHRHLLYSLPAA